MSAIREPVVLGGTRGYTLRHIGPKAVIWPDAPGYVSTFPVLGQAAMIARPLPGADPGSDWQTGQWSGRLNDAGDGQVIFPNAVASDGAPWRERFDAFGQNQWVEVYNDGELEQVFCVITDGKEMPSVTVAGNDGMWVLKKAYERDWIVVQAPRDIIERGTQMWVALLADQFPPGALSPHWVQSITAGGLVTMGAAGDVKLTAASGTTSTTQIATHTLSLHQPTGAWRAYCTVLSTSLPAGAAFTCTIFEDGSEEYVLGLFPDAMAGFSAGTGLVGIAPTQAIPTAVAYGLMLESDGEWIWAFINGELVGWTRRLSATTTTLEMDLTLSGGTSLASTAVLDATLMLAQQPFLMAGIDKGDFVLPGDITTYPSGGLHARYYNDLDLQGLDVSLRIGQVLHPSRSQAYGGSATAEYANQQDPTFRGQTNPQPGAASSHWSAVWFGSIYLKLSAGDYTFQLIKPAASSCAVRVWIGQTLLGQEKVADWTFGSAVSLYTFTVSANPATPGSLRGALPYDGGFLARDGWYPIKVEYAVDATGHDAPTLDFVTVPANYTDPGGTSITAASMPLEVPPTSLSPLGCIDQRYQGISHFDLVQQTLNSTGLQASCEPKRLESGEFPGVLAPRVREGADSDIILRPDSDFRAEGILSYSNVEDATDSCSSIQGNGAGFQNTTNGSAGLSGNLQALVFDADTMMSGLCDLQAWQDFSDAAYSQLLEASLTSLLGLRMTPWQTVTATPVARDRRAREWQTGLVPLAGPVVKARFRPGDGVRLRASDVSLWDTSPRQLLTVQRGFTPRGVSASQVGWANRPRSDAHTLKQHVFGSQRLARSYQKQVVTLTGSLVIGTLAPSTASNVSVISLAGSDRVLSVVLRITVNSAAVSLGLLVNGSVAPGAPTWAIAPVNAPVNVGALLGANNRLEVALENQSASLSTTLGFQILADVLR